MIASRLLFIKSRNLLPKPATKDEEEEEDPGDALIRQLIEYRQFKEVANQLKARADAGLRVYVRSAPGPQLDKRLDLGGVDLSLLHKAVQKALAAHAVRPAHAARPHLSHQWPSRLRTRNYIRDAQRLMRPLREVPTTPVSFTELLSQRHAHGGDSYVFGRFGVDQAASCWRSRMFGEIVLMPVGVAVENGDMVRLNSRRHVNANDNLFALSLYVESHVLHR
ncbi:MAG: segregation/condensation protein A [Caldilineaceae bacterium]